MLFDSHTHLDSHKFNSDRDKIIQKTFESGVSLIMNPGADYESSVAACELSAKYDFIYAAVGVHPCSVDTLDDMMLSLLKAMARKKKVKAIGEIGLDYHWDNVPRDVQEHWFRKQLQLARSLKMPVIIHDREANNDVFRILKEENAFEYGVLMHCFSGSAELARQYVKLGAYLSIAGPVTFKNARKLVEVVEAIDLDMLMIETDSPYLTPEPKRGKRNDSSYVKYVAQKIAEIKEMSYDEVAEVTTRNAKKFFKID